MQATLYSLQTQRINCNKPSWSDKKAPLGGNANQYPKSKVLVLSQANHGNIEIYEEVLEEVDDFPYLGTIISNSGRVEGEIASGSPGGGKVHEITHL